MAAVVIEKNRKESVAKVTWNHSEDIIPYCA